ncbi:MAG: ArsR family transcriptional regulator [Coprobacillus cateniformis]
MNVSRATIDRYLKILMKMNLIEKVGS